MTRFEFDIILLTMHIEIIELNNNIQAYRKHHVTRKNIFQTVYRYDNINFNSKACLYTVTHNY